MKKVQDGIFGFDVMLVVGCGGFGLILIVLLINLNKNWKDFSWKFGIDGDIVDGVLGYVNVVKGYKVGGFFFGLLLINIYDLEKLIVYVVGIKLMLFDCKLWFNVEVFYWDYMNYQISSLGLFDLLFNFLGVLLLIVCNVGKVEIYGIEIEMVFVVILYDCFMLNLFYFYVIFINLVVVGLFGQLIGDFLSNCLLYVFDWSGMIGYQYDFDLVNGGQIIVVVWIYVESWQYLLYFYMNMFGLGIEQKGFMMLSVSFGYYVLDDCWYLLVYVKNIENWVVVNIFVELLFEFGNFYGELNLLCVYGVIFGVKWQMLILLQFVFIVDLLCKEFMLVVMWMFVVLVIVQLVGGMMVIGLFLLLMMLIVKVLGWSGV